MSRSLCYVPPLISSLLLPRMGVSLFRNLTRRILLAVHVLTRTYTALALLCLLVLVFTQAKPHERSTKEYTNDRPYDNTGYPSFTFQ